MTARTNVVSTRYDHVVGAALKPEVTRFIQQIDIAGDVPTVAHIAPLPFLVIHVTTARGTLDRQLSDASLRQRLILFIEHADPIARQSLARGTRPDLIAHGGDEYVHHFRGANAVDQAQPRGSVPGIRNGFRQGLTGRDAAAQTR